MPNCGAATRPQYIALSYFTLSGSLMNVFIDRRYSGRARHHALLVQSLLAEEGAKREPARAKPQEKTGDTFRPNHPGAVAPPLLCEEGNDSHLPIFPSSAFTSLVVKRT